MERLFKTHEERAQALVTLTAAFIASRAQSGKHPTPCRNAYRAIEQLQQLEQAYEGKCCTEEKD